MESSLQAIGNWSWTGGFSEVAQTNTVARSALGEVRWQLDAIAWPGLESPWFEQRVLDDGVLDIAGEGLGLARVVERDLAGERVCETKLPELATATPANSSRSWTVRGRAVVVQVRSPGEQRSLLLQPRSH